LSIQKERVLRKHCCEVCDKINGNRFDLHQSSLFLSFIMLCDNIYGGITSFKGYPDLHEHDGLEKKIGPNKETLMK